MSFLSRIKEMGKTKGDDEVPSEALSTEGDAEQKCQSQPAIAQITPPADQPLAGMRKDRGDPCRLTPDDRLPASAAKHEPVRN